MCFIVYLTVMRRPYIVYDLEFQRSLWSRSLYVCLSGYNLYSYVCENINLFMTLSSGEASGQGLCVCVLQWV